MKPLIRTTSRSETERVGGASINTRTRNSRVTLCVDVGATSRTDAVGSTGGVVTPRTDPVSLWDTDVHEATEAAANAITTPRRSPAMINQRRN